MASDVDWIARFRAESERIAQYDPVYAAGLPQTLLLNEIDRLTAERDVELARIGSVRTLHQRCECRRELDISLTPIVHCDCCDEDWPCTTIQTLDAPPRGLSAPHCGAYMSEWVCTLPPGRHPGWRHFDADGNWWDQTRCPTDCGEPAYRHAANGCPEGPKTTEETPR